MIKRWRLSIFTLCTLLASTPGFSEKMPLNSLDELRWKNRIILLKSDTNKLQELERLSSEIKERDIIWFFFTRDNLHSNYKEQINDQLYTSVNAHYFSKDEAEQETVILIGKDGGIKYSSHDFNLIEIFERIDSMPMRIKEMR